MVEHFALNLETPPSALISTTDAKKHLNVSHANDDSYIDAIVSTATRLAEEYLNRRLMAQTWTYYLDRFPMTNIMRIPYGPLRTVDSLEYLDPESGSYTTWGGSNYVVDTVSSPARIIMGPDVTQWPNVDEDQMLAVKITMGLGYATAADVPTPIVHGIKMMLAHMYENREDVTDEGEAKEIPMNSRYIMMPFRIFHFV